MVTGFATLLAPYNGYLEATRNRICRTLHSDFGQERGARLNPALCAKYHYVVREFYNLTRRYFTIRIVHLHGKRQ